VIVMLGALAYLSRYGTRTAIGGKLLARRAWRWARA
jgi:hypothetical protein